MRGRITPMSNPLHDTTGDKTVVIRVELAAGGDANEHIARLVPRLLLAVNESATAALTGARCISTTSGATATGQLAIFLHVRVNLDAWNRELGPGHTADNVTEQVRGLILQEVEDDPEASLVDVLTQLVV